MTIPYANSLRLVRYLLDLGQSLEEAVNNSSVPADHRDLIRTEIERDRLVIIRPATVIRSRRDGADWYNSKDRSSFVYWPNLRRFLLGSKGLPDSAVTSIDESSDRVMRQLSDPRSGHFDVRGLVIGYVQSGKTANYSSVIAKAADVGYRLFIVLSGIDNGLRRQTNMRLRNEVVGRQIPGLIAAPLPPQQMRWIEFTTPELHGDFAIKNIGEGALQGSQPILMVVKKHTSRLQHVINWLKSCPADSLASLPMLVIDDEADQASIDTRGSLSENGSDRPPDWEPPSTINGRIRELLSCGSRRVAYIAYTATPFANVLIPHKNSDPHLGADLYPKDFIVDLPKPAGYTGAEEYFGKLDEATGDRKGGIDAIRYIGDLDELALDQGEVPATLETALLSFILAAAARASRGDGDQPATMLIHTSQLTIEHGKLRSLVEGRFWQMRDEWRYDRKRNALRAALVQLWLTDFVPTTQAVDPSRVVSFDIIEPLIERFMNDVEVREVNSSAGDLLDYELNPRLKAIAIGGNKLSRGLTLEGLLVSYFARRSATYDTLLQMGRWFGFRAKYADVTRVFTTPELAEWFSDLAFVEERLRDDIQMYEDQGLTPLEVGPRVLAHPAMDVTAAPKRRYTSSITVSRTYSGALEQTVKFPLRRLSDLRQQSVHNIELARDLLAHLGSPTQEHESGPIWTAVTSKSVVDFLCTYRMDDTARSIAINAVVQYIDLCNQHDELTNWTIAVCGRQTFDPRLGRARWGDSFRINQISRTRLGDTDSIGVLTSADDEGIGLNDEQRSAALADVSRAENSGQKASKGRAFRLQRHASNGLLLLYPISRYSGADKDESGTTRSARRRLFDDPDEGCDLVGFALSLPRSPRFLREEIYIRGTAPQDARQ